MKGNKKIIELLNDVLTSELTAVNQYFLHARMCDNWGYLRLAEIVRKESIGEMKHADELIERILYLEGLPNVQRLDKIGVGETVPEQLRLDRDLEVAAIARLNKGIALCVQSGDNGSRSGPIRSSSASIRIAPSPQRLTSSTSHRSSGSRRAASASAS